MVDISRRSKVVVALLWTCACFAAAANAVELTEHTSQHLTLHIPGSGTHTLEVRSVEGNITVQAYEGTDVDMTIDRSLSAENDAQMRAARREVVLDAGADSATAHAIVRYPGQQTCGGPNGYTSRPGYHARFDFTIRVPRGVRLQLCTINNGVVVDSGTIGDFDITNVNGRITMTDVAGSGNVLAVNGAVTASFVSAPQRASTFRTVNGDVVITLPDRSSAAFHMKTLNGHLFTDFASEPKPQDAGIIGGLLGGKVRTVRTGTGVPDLTLESLNGDVRALRRPK